MLKDRIIAARKRKRLKQTELADMLAVSIDTVRRWEQGKRTPNADKLKPIADALDTTIAYLTGDTNTPERTQSAPKERSVQEDRGILSYTFSNGERLEVPATQEGYAFLREAISNSRKDV